MGTWKRLLEALKEEPLGFPADGRMLSVGLAAAAQQESARRSTEEVEAFLRRNAAGEREQRVT